MAIDESFKARLDELVPRRLKAENVATNDPRRHAQIAVENFEYTSFVIATMNVGTNALESGRGDSGHGFFTEVRLTFEGGDLSVAINGSERQEVATLTLHAGGCDEAEMLARLLELAGASLRRSIVANTAAADEAFGRTSSTCLAHAPRPRNAIEAKPGRMYRVVETDNFGGDYPNESFEGPCMTYEDCERVAAIFNAVTGDGSDRFYKTEHESYKLAPGFEP